MGEDRGPVAWRGEDYVDTMREHEEMRRAQARLAAASRHAALAERRYNEARARRHVAGHELLLRLWEN